MATIPVSLFFQGALAFGVDNIGFDLLLSESHDFQAVATSHPVEDGTIISDHIQNQLRTGGITGLTTNFSLYSNEILVTNRAQDAFDAFKQLYENREIVTVYTIYEVYEDVVITNMPIARDASSGESITIQVNFQQVKQVKLQEIVLELAIKVANLNTSINRQAAAATTAGRTTTTSNAGSFFP